MIIETIGGPAYFMIITTTQLNQKAWKYQAVEPEEWSPINHNGRPALDHRKRGKYK